MGTDRSDVWVAVGLVLLLSLAGCATGAARWRAHKTVDAALAAVDSADALGRFAAVAGAPRVHAPAILARLKAMRRAEKLSPEERRLLYLATLVRAPEFAPHIVRLCGADAPRFHQATVPDPRDFALAAFVAFLGTDLRGARTPAVETRLEWLGRQTPEPRHAGPAGLVPSTAIDLSAEEAATLETSELVNRLAPSRSFSERASAADELVGRSDTPAFLPALYAYAATAPEDDPRHWIEGDLQLAILRAEKLKAAERKP